MSNQLVLGTLATHSTSYAKYGRKGYGGYRFPKNVIYRFQSLKPMHDPGAHPLMGGASGSDFYYNLPMFAIDLSDAGDMGISATVPDKGRWVIHPMYQLRKTWDVAAPLRNTQSNYNWVPVAGVNNNPASAPGGASNDTYGWYREQADDGPCNGRLNKHLWSQIKVNLVCSNSAENTCHIGIVRFDEDVAPIRKYIDNDNSVLPPANTIDTDFSGSEERCSRKDMFWESFWAHRIVHPMSMWCNPDKDRYMKILHHTTIKALPHNGIDPVTHMREIFVGSLGVNNCTSSKYNEVYDIISNGEVRNPPLRAADYASRFGEYCGAYNQVLKHSMPSPYQDDKNRTKWLLIWCDHKGGASAVGDLGCAFDVQVRSKFAIEEKNNA